MTIEDRVNVDPLYGQSIQITISLIHDYKNQRPLVSNTKILYRQVQFLSRQIYLFQLFCVQKRFIIVIYCYYLGSTVLKIQKPHRIIYQIFVVLLSAIKNICLYKHVLNIFLIQQSSVPNFFIKKNFLLLEFLEIF